MPPKPICVHEWKFWHESTMCCGDKIMSVAKLLTSIGWRWMIPLALVIGRYPMRLQKLSDSSPSEDNAKPTLTGEMVRTSTRLSSFGAIPTLAPPSIIAAN